MIDWYGHISGDEAVLTFDTPSFAQLVTDTQGNAGDSTDGFDAGYAQVLADMDGLSALIDELDSLTGAVLGLNDVLSENPLADETPLLDSNLADLDADLAGFVTVTEPAGITPQPDSGPPPAPTPPSTTTTYTAAVVQSYNDPSSPQVMCLTVNVT